MWSFSVGVYPRSSEDSRLLNLVMSRKGKFLGEKRKSSAGFEPF